MFNVGCDDALYAVNKNNCVAFFVCWEHCVALFVCCEEIMTVICLHSRTRLYNTYNQGTRPQLRIEKTLSNYSQIFGF